MASRLSTLLGSQNLTKLAVRTGLSVERLELLRGGTEPSMAEVRALARGLKMPMNQLMADDSAEPVRTLFRHGFHRLAKADPQVTADDIVSERLARALELVHRYDGGWLGSAPRDVSSSHEGAESLAIWFRGVFCGGDIVRPLHDLPEILEDHVGIPVLVGDSRYVEGASIVSKGWPLIFVARRFGPRMLFTLAHELAHILSHHDLSSDVAFIDEDLEAFSASSDERIESERFANAFASSLLLPSQAVGIALRSIRKHLSIKREAAVGDVELSYMARIFGVSFSVAASRCEVLGLIPRGGAASLNEKMKKDFGSAEKRADAVGVPPRDEIDFPVASKVLLREAVRSVKEGRVSVGRAAEVLEAPLGTLYAANAMLPQ